VRGKPRGQRFKLRGQSLQLKRREQSPQREKAPPGPNQTDRRAQSRRQLASSHAVRRGHYSREEEREDEGCLVETSMLRVSEEAHNLYKLELIPQYCDREQTEIGCT